MKYSEAFKTKMVQKMLAGRSANSVAQEVGINQPTLSKWLRDARTVPSVSKRGSKPEAGNETSRRPEDWSAEEKLEVVLAARGLGEAELGELLRRRGLHEEQLTRWREAVESGALESLRGSRKVSTKSGDAKRIKGLERELRRKEKALAEAAALLVLQKKAQALWGTRTPPPSRRTTTSPRTDQGSRSRRSEPARCLCGTWSASANRSALGC